MIRKLGQDNEYELHQLEDCLFVLTVFIMHE